MQFMDGIAGEWGLRIIIGILFFWGASFIYLRYTGGMGKSVFIFISLLLLILFYQSYKAQFMMSALLIAYIFIYTNKSTRQKEEFDKPKAVFEGGGKRRGLTLPETALLLERPFNQVITLIIVELIRKRIVQNNGGNRLSVRDEMKSKKKSLSVKERARQRKEGVRKINAVLLTYEEPVIQIIEQNEGKKIEEVDFDILRKLIEMHVGAKMSGYDAEMTKKYYLSKVDHARKQIEEIIDNKAQGREANYYDLKWIFLSWGKNQKSDLSEQIIQKMGFDRKEFSYQWYIELIERIGSEESVKNNQ